MSWKEILKTEEKAHCGTEKLEDDDPFEKKLVGNQKKIDANKDGKITGEDFKQLREKKSKKRSAFTSED
tara:strand:+ start:130 stop:336 length:207 start_codon:yes stop_codon:yes gene_type:complete